MKKLVLASVVGALMLGSPAMANTFNLQKHGGGNWKDCSDPKDDACSVEATLELTGEVDCVCAIGLTSNMVDVFESGYASFNGKVIGSIEGGCNTPKGIDVTLASDNGGMMNADTNTVYPYTVYLGTAMTYTTAGVANQSATQSSVSATAFASATDVKIDMTLSGVPEYGSYSDTLTVTIAGIM
ncbi:hypothetical protein [Vibrio comitans]|uniref:Spore coat protein U domain-containing protein n=1 Tax=Vibrio comitans NBRC 102076 TaxID=1219078 RepID=A0A4Y3INN2_9VIBR|nr:hypothetical protein [Vibrio comitans]GEA60847.1 hypothetical protein VCO01S_20400 [Vibrio comitans NBRC 102076]